MMKRVTALAPLLALLVSVLACTKEVERVVVVTPTQPPATATAQPPATPTPAPPTPLPDRMSCEEIKGTEYRSPTERQWYLANCVPTPAPVTAGIGGRTPGQVRLITTPMGQYECYQLGQADAAQDQTAGVTLTTSQPGGPFAVTGTMMRGDTLWRMQNGSVIAEVRLGADVDPGTCGVSYADGYTGAPFNQR